jgi:hypothetical protein
VVCCGFRYCGVRHNPTVYRNTLLHLPKNGNQIEPESFKAKATKPCNANHPYRLLSWYSDGNAREGKMRFTIIMTFPFVDPGTADMHDPDPTHTVSTSDTHTCPTLITLLSLQIASESRSRCPISLLSPHDKFVRIQVDHCQRRAHTQMKLVETRASSRRFSDGQNIPNAWCCDPALAKITVLIILASRCR